MAFQIDTLRDCTSKALAIGLLPLLSGCISATAIQVLEVNSSKRSHVADRANAAYRTDSGDVVIFVGGRLAEHEADAHFSLVLSKHEISRIRTEFSDGFHLDNSNRLLPVCRASIGPDANFRLPDWTLLPLSPSTYPEGRWENLELAYPASGSSPAVFASERGVGGTNQKDLQSRWGEIELFYTDTYPDGTALRCLVEPDAVEVRTGLNGKLLLPITVPLDVATLPLQAVWAALFVASAGAH